MLHEMAEFGIFMLGLFVTIKLFIFFAFLAVSGVVCMGAICVGITKKIMGLFERKN